MYESLHSEAPLTDFFIFTSQETTTHCIYLNKDAICPGTVVDVENEVTIMAGFTDNSAAQATETPAWVEKTYKLQRRIPNDVQFGQTHMKWIGLTDDILKVTFQSDNCLYIRIQVYPWWFPAPPLAVDGVTNAITLGHGTQFNWQDQREFPKNRSQKPVA